MPALTARLILAAATGIFGAIVAADVLESRLTAAGLDHYLLPRGALEDTLILLRTLVVVRVGHGAVGPCFQTARLPQDIGTAREGRRAGIGGRIDRLERDPVDAPAPSRRDGVPHEDLLL